MSDIDVVPALPADPLKTSRSDRRRAWTVTALLMVFMMVNFADKSVLGLAAGPIRTELHLSATQFGLANSAFFLLFCVAGAALGLLSDRTRPRWLLLGMALLWSIAQLPVALGGGLAVLVGSRIVLGGAEGPAFPVAEHAALSWFPEGRRNLSSALVAVGTTLGVVVAAPSLTWVITHHGWRSAFGIVAAAGLLWTFVWAAVGSENPEANPRARENGPASAGPVQTGAPKISYRSIVRSRTWIGATAAYFGTYWIAAVILTWLPSYLESGMGYSTAKSAVIVALVWAVNGIAILTQSGVTGGLLRRGVTSRWAGARLGGIVLLISAAGCFALGLTGRGAATVPLLLVAFGICGVMAAVSVTSVAEIAPAASRGGALGLMNAVVTTAGLIAPTVIGRLVDTQGKHGYQSAVLLSGGVLLLAGLAAVTLIDPARDSRRLAR
jgi:MFS family permease